MEHNFNYIELGLKKLRVRKSHGFSSFSDHDGKLYSPDSCGISGVITTVVLLAIAFGVYELSLSDGQDALPLYPGYPPYSHHNQRLTNSAGPFLEAVSLSSQVCTVQLLALAVLS